MFGRRHSKPLPSTHCLPGRCSFRLSSLWTYSRVERKTMAHTRSDLHPGQGKNPLGAYVRTCGPPKEPPTERPRRVGHGGNPAWRTPHVGNCFLFSFVYCVKTRKFGKYPRTKLRSWDDGTAGLLFANGKLIVRIWFDGCTGCGGVPPRI